MNNKQREDAKSKFQKNFFKLMNNSVLGKTTENVRNHKNIKLITNYNGLLKCSREPNVMNIKCFIENLLAAEMRKSEIKMCKPVYLGQAILDISKALMSEFYYEYLKLKCNGKVRLCYTDTDIFIVHVKIDDFYKDINNDVNNRFDTSGYSENTNRLITAGVNKKKLGMMKDKLGPDEMIESVNVCAKLYSYLRQTCDGKIKESMKAKGVKKCLEKIS